MSEEFPKDTDPENISTTSNENIEKGSATYEDVLSILRNLKAKGIDNPLDDESPDTQEFLKTEGIWKELQNLPSKGAENTEQAMGLINVITLMVEAGYSDAESVKDALDGLFVEKQLAEEKENNDAIVALIEAEIEKLENILSENKPEKKLPALIEQAMDAAKIEAENENFKEANRILTEVILMTRYKKLFTANPDKKAELKKLQEEYKLKWWAQRGF